MINHKEIQQHSIEWFEKKWGKIGGTLSKGLFVKSDTLLIDIVSQLAEECEIEEDGYKSDSMERGTELEPFAREYLEKYTGYTFEQSGWLQCEENILLGISPDGITANETVCCEIKCFGRKNHTSIILNDEIPSENIPQLIHYFTVNPKLEKLFFLCFRPESKKHFFRELTRNTEVAIGTKKTTETRPNPKGVMYDYVITVPDSRPISEWVTVAKCEAANLLTQVNEKLEQLNSF